MVFYNSNLENHTDILLADIQCKKKKIKVLFYLTKDRYYMFVHLYFLKMLNLIYLTYCCRLKKRKKKNF